MANLKHGLQTYTFGIADGLDIVGGLKLESISFESAPEFEAEGKNLVGNTVTLVQGEDKINFNASGYVIAEATFDAVATFEYDGRFYIINRRTKNHSNSEFVKAEIQGQSFALIDAP